MYVCPVYPFSICFKGFSLWLYFVSVRCWGFTVIQELHTHVPVTHTYIFCWRTPTFTSTYILVFRTLFSSLFYFVFIFYLKNSYWCGKPFGYTMYVYDCILASFVCNFLFLIFLFSIRFVFRLFSFFQSFSSLCLQICRYMGFFFHLVTYMAHKTISLTILSFYFM